MTRTPFWLTLTAAVALLPGCIVIHEAPPQPAPPPPPPQAPAPKPQEAPPPPQAPPPAAQEPAKPQRFGLSASILFPVELEGRAKAVDQGRGGVLNLNDDLDMDLRPAYRLRGWGTTNDGDPFTVRLVGLSLTGEGTLDEEESHGGNSYFPGAVVDSRLEWFYGDIQMDQYFLGDADRTELEFGMGAGFWWLGMEVEDDSMDSAALVFGPSARFSARPAPILELGAEAAARAGPAFPFPGIAGTASIEGWVGLNIEDRFIFRLGYAARIVSSRITDRSLHYDTSQGKVDKNETVERDRLAFEYNGPFFEVEFRF